MAIQFDNTGTKYVKWAAPTNALGLITKTVCLWYYHNAAPSSFGTLFTIFDGTGTDSDEYNVLLVPSTGVAKIGWLAHFSTTDGVWKTTNNVLAAGNLYHIALTYNGSAVGNNPLIYINGVSQAVTRDAAPVGTYRSGTNTDLYLGTPIAGGNPNGKVQDGRVYNRILTAAEILALASPGRSIEMNDNGLKFHATALYSANKYPAIPFSGILGATDYMYDRINGYQGVPSGSPVGAADLAYGTGF
jgi:hypothetical protein